MLQLVFARCPTKTVEGVTEHAFGLNNSLPWGHVKQDMKNFAARTKGTVLIMGAKTFESFSSPLPGRDHIVVCDPGRPQPLAGNGDRANAYISMDDFKAFLNGADVSTTWTNHIIEGPETYQRNFEDFSIIGGKTLIEIALSFVDKVVATTIIKKHRVNSDVQLSEDFINELISSRVMTENHWYQADELTQVIETVYGEKR